MPSPLSGLLSAIDFRINLKRLKEDSTSALSTGNFKLKAARLLAHPTKFSTQEKDVSRPANGAIPSQHQTAFSLRLARLPASCALPNFPNFLARVFEGLVIGKSLFSCVIPMNLEKSCHGMR